MHSFDPQKPRPVDAKTPPEGIVGIPPRRKPKPEPLNLGERFLLACILLGVYWFLIFTTGLAWNASRDVVQWLF